MDIPTSTTRLTVRDGVDEPPNPRPLPGAIIVPITSVRRDPSQPRRDWRANDGYQRLDELTKSIREFGILQPLVVRQQDEGYIVITGGRRLVAAQRAGLTEIPVIVHSDDSTVRIRVLQLIENVQRHDLTPLDEARAFQELIDLEHLTPPQIALRVRVSEQYVRDRLRILRDQVLADAVERRQIAMSVAREINKLADAAAEVLRRRVEAGEKVEMADIHAMRRELAAAGIVNPRLSPRADRTAPTGGDHASQDSPEARSTELAGGTDGQTMLEADMRVMQPWTEGRESGRVDRTVRGALTQIEQDYRRYRATSVAPDAASPGPQMQHVTSSGARTAVPAQGALAQQGRTDSVTTGDTMLEEIVEGLDRERVRRLLLLALERGWNIPGLLQALGTVTS